MTIYIALQGNLRLKFVGFEAAAAENKCILPYGVHTILQSSILLCFFSGPKKASAALSLACAFTAAGKRDWGSFILSTVPVCHLQPSFSRWWCFQSNAQKALASVEQSVSAASKSLCTIQRISYHNQNCCGIICQFSQPFVKPLGASSLFLHTIVTNWKEGIGQEEKIGKRPFFSLRIQFLGSFHEALDSANV